VHRDACIEDKRNKFQRYLLTVQLIAALDIISERSGKFKIMGIETLLHKVSNSGEVTPDIIIKDSNDHFLIVEIKTSLPFELEQLEKKIDGIQRYKSTFAVGINRDIRIFPDVAILCETSDINRLIDALEKQKITDVFVLEWSQKYSVKRTTDVIFIRGVNEYGKSMINGLFKDGIEIPLPTIELEKLEKGRLLPIKPPLNYLLDFLWTIIFPKNAVKKEENVISEMSIDEIIGIIRDEYGYFFNLGEWTSRTIRKKWIKEAMYALALMNLAKPTDKTNPAFANHFEIYLNKIQEKNVREYFSRRICTLDLEAKIKKKSVLFEKADKQSSLDSFMKR